MADSRLKTIQEIQKALYDNEIDVSQCLVKSLGKYGKNETLYGNVKLEEGSNVNITYDTAHNSLKISTSGSGASKWTDSGSLTYLTDTDNDLAVGGSGANASFYITASTGDVKIAGSLTDGTHSVTPEEGETAYTHSQVLHDYDFISGNDADTDVTGKELEELTDGSVTSLHSHASLGTITADIGSVSSVDVSLLGGEGIETRVVGDTIVFTNLDTGTGAVSVHQLDYDHSKLSLAHAQGSDDQNLWETIRGDIGSVTASGKKDILTISGGEGIDTRIIGNELCVTNLDKGTDAVETHMAEFHHLNLYDTSDLPEGSNLYYTDKRVNDRVADLIQDGIGISWAYDSGAGTLTGNVSITQYTDEMAQDAVGGILVDSDTIEFTYDNTAPSITAIVKGDSITYNEIDWSTIDTDDITEGSVNLWDKEVSLTEGDGIEITGSYPNFTITNLYPPQNLWEKIIADYGSVTADDPKDVLTITGGIGIATEASGDEITIDNDDLGSAAVSTHEATYDHSLLDDLSGAITVQADIGEYLPTADLPLRIAGGEGIDTRVVGNEIVITNIDSGIGAVNIHEINYDHSLLTKESGISEIKVMAGIGEYLSGEETPIKIFGGAGIDTRVVGNEVVITNIDSGIDAVNVHELNYDHSLLENPVTESEVWVEAGIGRYLSTSLSPIRILGGEGIDTRIVGDEVIVTNLNGGVSAVNVHEINYDHSELYKLKDGIPHWDTAYGWGNHSLAGYMDTATADTLYHRLDSANTPFTGKVKIITGEPTSLEIGSSTPNLNRDVTGIKSQFIGGVTSSFDAGEYIGYSGIVQGSNSLADASPSTISLVDGVRIDVLSSGNITGKFGSGTQVSRGGMFTASHSGTLEGGDGTVEVIGLEGSADNNTIVDNGGFNISSYGVKGVARQISLVSGKGFIRTYGGYFSAQGNGSSGSYAYGILASASGANTNYAGYFAGDVFSTGSVSGVTGSFLTSVYGGVVKAGNGTASLPSYTFNAYPTTGMYLVDANRLGFTTGGVKCAEFNATCDLVLSKKLAINYTGVIDTGVQVHIKGDASNNANIRIDGYSSGFFYFGFNQPYSRAAMSVSDGVTTAWDALNIDALGNVSVGLGLISGVPIGARLHVINSSSSVPTCILRNQSTGDILGVYSGASKVINIGRYGKVEHIASGTSARSVMTLHPLNNTAMQNIVEYDISYYVRCNSVNCWISFGIPSGKIMGGAIKIRKIVVRGMTATNDDYINQIQIVETPVGGSQTTAWNTTTKYGYNQSGESDWTVYNSTGITITDPAAIDLEINQIAGGRVRIRGIIMEYDLA